MPFTIKELNKAVRNLKDKKCPGHYEITNKILKATGNNMRRSMLDMINWMWKNEQIPTKLKEIDIKSLYKGNGKTSELKNHRGICIGCSIIKLYEKMIDERSSPIIETQGFTETQAGGRPNRGIADHLFIIRAIIYYKLTIIIELVIFNQGLRQDDAQTCNERPLDSRYQRENMEEYVHNQ